MTADSKEEYACSCLKAAVGACKRAQLPRAQKQFSRFIELLKAYRVTKPLPNLESNEPEPPSHDSFPTDLIPTNLVALASCFHHHAHPEYAEEALNTVIELISSDRKLSFLRQNVFQEIANHYTDRWQFAEAEELYSKQLAIVSVKGSKVLVDFVNINRLINLGNLHASTSRFDESELAFREALSLIERTPEKHKAQILRLHDSWTKLEGLTKDLEP